MDDQKPTKLVTIPLQFLIPLLGGLGGGAGVNYLTQEKSHAVSPSVVERIEKERLAETKEVNKMFLKLSERITAIETELRLQRKDK